MNKKLGKWMLFLAIVSVSGSVLAEHFNFTVPVQLNQIRQGVARAKVFCETLDKNNKRVGGKYSGWLDINNGTLNENVSIKFNAHSGKNPITAVKYKCHLELLTPWNKEKPWNIPPETTNSMYLNHEEGTPFQVIVAGPIKRPTRVTPKIKIDPKRLHR